MVNQSPEDARSLVTILNRESWVDTLAPLGPPLTGMDTVQIADPKRLGWRTAYYCSSSGELFRLLRIPLLRGRTFTREEGANRAPVAVIGELAAKQLWPREDPIGKTISIQASQKDNPWLPPFREALVDRFT